MTKPIPTMSERLRQIERKALAAAETAVDVGDLAKAASALVVLDSARNNRGNEEHIPFAPGPYEPRAAFTYNGPRTVEAFDAFARKCRMLLEEEARAEANAGTLYDQGHVNKLAAQFEVAAS